VNDPQSGQSPETQPASSGGPAAPSKEIAKGLADQPLPPREELIRKLAVMRQEISKHLALIMAAAKLIQKKPQMAEEMLAAIVEQTLKISAVVKTFSSEFARVLETGRPDRTSE
jgi:hypothetical protein